MCTLRHRANQAVDRLCGPLLLLGRQLRAATQSAGGDRGEPPMTFSRPYGGSIAREPPLRRDSFMEHDTSGQAEFPGDLQRV